MAVGIKLSVMCNMQTGMRGAFGKPQGVCARVAIGQILLSIRCKDVHSAQVCPLLQLQSGMTCSRSKLGLASDVLNAG